MFVDGLWAVMLYSLVHDYNSFGGTYCLSLQDEVHKDQVIYISGWWPVRVERKRSRVGWHRGHKSASHTLVPTRVDFKESTVKNDGWAEGSIDSERWGNADS
jgi:hypothetical protein